MSVFIDDTIIYANYQKILLINTHYMICLHWMDCISFVFLPFVVFWNNFGLQRAQALLIRLHFSIAHWQQLNI